MITIDNIKTANKVRRGAFWFSPGSMAFFHSHVFAEVYARKGACYFITSERFDDYAPTRFTVRMAPLTDRGWPTGEIETVGEFQQHASYPDAVAAIALGEHGACISEVAFEFADSELIEDTRNER